MSLYFRQGLTAVVMYVVLVTSYVLLVAPPVPFLPPDSLISVFMTYVCVHTHDFM